MLYKAVRPPAEAPITMISRPLILILLLGYTRMVARASNMEILCSQPAFIAFIYIYDLAVQLVQELTIVVHKQ